MMSYELVDLHRQGDCNSWTCVICAHEEEVEAGE